MAPAERTTGAGKVTVTQRPPARDASSQWLLLIGVGIVEMGICDAAVVPVPRTCRSNSRAGRSAGCCR